MEETHDKPLSPAAPREITYAAALLCAALLLGIIQGTVVYFRSPARYSATVWICIFVGTVLFNSWIIWFISKGRNWARIVFLLQLLLGLLLTLVNVKAVAATPAALTLTTARCLADFLALSLIVSYPGCDAFTRTAATGGQSARPNAPLDFSRIGEVK